MFRTKSVEQSIRDTDEPDSKLRKDLTATDLTVFGVAVVIGARPFGQGERRFDALFRSLLGVRLPIANSQCSLVFGDRVIALIFHVKNSSKVNMRPGQHAGIAGEPHRLAECALGVVDISLNQAGSRQDEVRPSRIASVILKRSL